MDLTNVTGPYKMLINGNLVDARSSGNEEIINPATERLLAVVPRAGERDVSEAIDAADRTFREWSETPLEQRAAAVVELAGRLRSNYIDLAHLEALDSGNTVTAMRNDVLRAADVLEYMASLRWEMKGFSLPPPTSGAHFTVREPIGPVARIIPFNHPIMFAAEKIGAPLIAGNTVVLKLAPQAPLTGLRLAELAQDVFPPGVVNIITGFDEKVGIALTTDKRIRRIALTGSVATGRAIMRQAADHLPIVSFELGGKNPSIVFPGVGLPRVADGALAAMNLGWQGQSCGSATRLFVHESIRQDLLELLKVRFQSVRIGDPTDDGTEMGPIISKRQYERVVSYIESARDEGATVLTGGRRPDGPSFQHGYWLEPTVLTDVTNDMQVAREEIFGPVLSVMTWEHEDEVVELANDTAYGLVANVWCNDLDISLRMVKRLQAGYVTVNGQGEHFRGLPFGGYKESGLGREEALDELLSYTETKSISLLPFRRSG